MGDSSSVQLATDILLDDAPGGTAHQGNASELARQGALTRPRIQPFIGRAGPGHECSLDRDAETAGTAEQPRQSVTRQHPGPRSRLHLSVDGRDMAVPEKYLSQQ